MLSFQRKTPTSTKKLNKLELNAAKAMGKKRRNWNNKIMNHFKNKLRKKMNLLHYCWWSSSRGAWSIQTVMGIDSYAAGNFEWQTTIGMKKMRFKNKKQRYKKTIYNEYSISRENDLRHHFYFRKTTAKFWEFNFRTYKWMITYLSAINAFVQEFQRWMLRFFFRWILVWYRSFRKDNPSIDCIYDSSVYTGHVKWEKVIR